MPGNELAEPYTVTAVASFAESVVDGARDPSICGAKRRGRDAICTQLAGHRTSHPGQGRCWLHGGLTPIKHGRYSYIERDRIRELVEHHEADADPLNLLPEVAALRALFQDYIERYDETTEALLAWHADWQLKKATPYDLCVSLEKILTEYEIGLRERDEYDEAEDTDRIAEAKKLVGILKEPPDLGKPRQVLDLADAHRILDSVGKMVERIQEAQNKNAISRPDLYRVIGEMGRVVDAHVVDERVRAKIKEGWLGIAI